MNRAATLERPPVGRPGPAAHDPLPQPSPPAASPARFRWGLEVAVALLLVGASLSLGRVFVGLGFLRPVLAAVALSLLITSGSRRLGAGPLVSLLATALAWLVFTGVAFEPDTIVALLVPTPATVAALQDTWLRGLDLLRLRPAPALAEPGLMLITVTGVWWVSHAVEGLVFRLDAPVRGVLMAMLLWTVPLALAPQGAGAWPWAVPFLAAAAVVLLAFAGADLARWGTWVDPWTGRFARGRRHPGSTLNPLAGNPLAPAGALIATVAIVAGVLGAARLPGADDPPWWQLRGLGGTTLTTNPIVNIRSNLVAQDTGTVLRVRTPRPVYLRTTALDVYSENEEWTNAGIRGSDVPPLVPFEVPIGPAERFWLDVEVVDLPGAVLVPVPYQAEAVAGPASGAFRYDVRSATFTLASGTTLQPGDRYSVFAAVPNPTAAALDSVAVFDPTGELTALPDNVPPEVGALASEIVARAGASSAFDKALAIQNELRSWEYSLDPPQGHSGAAMRTFLETRVGYCEQFAGTMAVMLRTLGIPARVAVGFSPGTLVDPEAGEYVITNANAHAWVEVLFPGMGWIAFEPTPRADGNVLVPTATNLAPTQTAAQVAPTAPIGPRQGDFPTGSTNPAMDSVEAQASDEQRAGTGGTGAGAPDDRTPSRLVAALVAALLLALAAAAVVRRRAATAAASPGERVDAALASVARVGRGLGVAPGPWETAGEHLHRVAAAAARDAGHAPAQDATAAERLAAAVGRARYARDVTEAVAVEAEDAAAALRRRLLDGRSPLARRLVLARGSVRAALAAAPRRPGAAVAGR